MRPKPFYAPGPQESIALWSATKFGRLSPFRSFFRFSPQWDYIWTKIEKRFEKDLNVRISCRTKAQSIPVGLGLKMALGAKLKKNYENFFTIPYYMTASLLFEDRPFCFFGPLTLGEFGPFISSEPFTFVFGLSSIMNRPFRPKAVYFDLFVQLGKVQIGISAMVERNDYSEHASRWSTRIYMGTPARYNCSK